MKHKIFYPSNILSEFINNYWIMESESNFEIASDIVIPTGSLEIMFHYGEPFKLSGARETDIIQSQLFLTGQKKSSYSAYTQGKTGVLAVSFKPYGASIFFKEPINLFTDKLIDLQDIFSNDAKYLLEELTNAESNYIRINIVEDFLVNRIIENKYFYIKRLKSIVSKIYQSRGNISIEKLSDIACLSPRQFERFFVANIGISPKYFMKIARLNNAIQYKKQNPKCLNLDIAIALGFYDESHLIKDFMNLTGLSPKEFFILDCL